MTMFGSSLPGPGPGYGPGFGPSLASSITVNCTSNSMSFQVELSRLGIQTADDLYLNEQHCKPRVDGSTLTYTWNLNTCGTTVSHGTNEVSVCARALCHNDDFLISCHNVRLRVRVMCACVCGHAHACVCTRSRAHVCVCVCVYVCVCVCVCVCVSWCALYQCP